MMRVFWIIFLGTLVYGLEAGPTITYKSDGHNDIEIEVAPSPTEKIPKHTPSGKNRSRKNKSDKPSGGEDSLDANLRIFGLTRYLYLSAGILAGTAIECICLMSGKLHIAFKYASGGLFGVASILVLIDYIYFRAIHSAYTMVMCFMVPVVVFTGLATIWQILSTPLSQALCLLGLIGLIRLIYSMFDGNPSSLPKEITFQEFLRAEYFLDQAVQKLVVYKNTSTVYVYLSPFYKGSTGKKSKTATLGKEADDNPANKESPKKIDESKEKKQHASESTTPSYVFNIGTLEHFEKVLKESQDLLYNQSLPMNYIPIVYAQESKGIPWTTLIFYGSLYYLFAFKFPFNVIFSNFRLAVHTEKLTKFDDVVGMDEIKREVTEYVDFLKDPSQFNKFGASLPKGALFTGPPGCGKTLLARAIAGEAGVPFIDVSGSQFVEMFVGIGSSRMRELFNNARAKAPCIVFIDEIDAIGKARNSNSSSGGHEIESTLNQLLVEMDGFKQQDDAHQIIIIGATNRVDILDDALKRPGRFDRILTFSPPTLKGRKDIFKLYMEKTSLAESVKNNLDKIVKVMAKQTSGLTGADIKNICNEAAILAIKRSHGVQLVEAEEINNSSSASSESVDDPDTEPTVVDTEVGVTQKDLQEAFERSITGMKYVSLHRTSEELLHTAYHEAGHAVIAWFDPNADVPTQVSIVARTSGALGFNLTPEKTSLITTKEDLLAGIRVKMGGRLAEELVYPDHISTGASNDLQKATELAYYFVAQYSLNEDQAPIMDTKRISEKMKAKIDEQVQVILIQCKKIAKEILLNKYELLHELAKKLVKYETLNKKQLVACLGAKNKLPKMTPKLTIHVESLNEDSKL